MKPVVAVLVRTDSFGEVWPGLVADAGGELRLSEMAAELAPLAGACGVVVSVAGVEERVGETVGEARSAGAAEVLAVGGASDHRIAAGAVRAGATDYFALPADLEALRGWVSERVERALARERAGALAAFERERFDFSRLVGRSAELAAALDRASRVIRRAGATVLITGETGTGKELLAQAIHANGPRAAAPFVEVNCTALPATLLEAELFGYEKGAFTDARAPKPGLFEAAHGGTLFLDEIGDIGGETQAKLLKALEDKQVRRLGSIRTITVDVRIIAATHVDLAAAVRAGRFREDLYYRLNVVPIHLPPLRERGDDILLLAEHFLDRFADEHDLPRPQISEDIRAALRSHSWPGNVRELRNALERALLLGDGMLRTTDLISESAARPVTSGVLPFPATMDEIEVAAARAMVARFAGNKSAAADALGISRSRLYRLLDVEGETQDGAGAVS